MALFSVHRLGLEMPQRRKSASAMSLDHAVCCMTARLITAVLIGNEACGAVLAVVVLAVATRFGPAGSPWLTAAIALAVTLPLVVLMAEVTPKTVAAKLPIGWARACVLPLAALAVVVTPVRIVITFVAELLLRPLGESVRGRPVRDLSEQEFRSLVDAGSAQGTVDARASSRWIQRVFRFSNR